MGTLLKECMNYFSYISLFCDVTEIISNKILFLTHVNFYLFFLHFDPIIAGLKHAREQLLLSSKENIGFELLLIREPTYVSYGVL